ncbi:uncharacterized protein [Diadema antillarum]|uniref:uncharacterized protein n=1 Tax=Diadema antillarum TaxID=105358 RepID=UPI003A85CBA4
MIVALVWCVALIASRSVDAELGPGALAGEPDTGTFTLGAALYITEQVQVIFDGRDHHPAHSLRRSVENNIDDDRHRRVKRSTSFDADEIEAILNKHNELRSQVSPEASNMKYMHWDDDLATMAQQWSEECLWEHGNPDNISPYSSVGQNLWLGTTSSPSGASATQSWYNEVHDYDYDTNSCDDGKVCGHYTQVVWANTEAVGCGIHRCDTVSNGWTNAYIITCNYGPAGNYVGTKPYLSGSPCTQCDSGVGQCYENQCRLCSEHNEECVCRASCQNCGTATSDCTCECQDGFYGSDCATVCEDTHENCGANPGWPTSWCTSDYQFVLNNCPLMCSLCGEYSKCTDNNTATRNIVLTVTAGPVSSPVSTPVSTPRSSTRRQTTTASCDITCDNGGTRITDPCECDCTSDYQGDNCQESKAEVVYGVKVLIYTSISRWTEFRDLLIRVVARIVTYWCNDNFEFCCPNLGTKTGNGDLSYVDSSHVAVAMGYPQDASTASQDAFFVMLLVTPPSTTDLCSSGSEYNNVAKRRKRAGDIQTYHYSNHRATRASEEGYLDQDALYQAISENVDEIEDELNVTVGEVTNGELIEESPASTGLASWAIAIIVIMVILLLVILVVGIVFIMLKGKKGKVQPEEKGRDAEIGSKQRKDGPWTDPSQSKTPTKASKNSDSADAGRRGKSPRPVTAKVKPADRNPRAGVRLQPLKLTNDKPSSKGKQSTNEKKATGKSGARKSKQPIRKDQKK